MREMLTKDLNHASLIHLWCSVRRQKHIWERSNVACPPEVRGYNLISARIPGNVRSSLVTSYLTKLGKISKEVTQIISKFDLYDTRLNFVNIWLARKS